MTARRYRRYLPLILGGVLLLETLAVAAVHVGILWPIEQERIRERRQTLQDLTDRAIVQPPAPPDPFKLIYKSADA